MSTGYEAHEAEVRDRGCLLGVVFAVVLWAMIFLAFCGCAQGNERLEKIAALTAFAVVDYDQSCELFYGNGYFNGTYELNPLLGK